MKWKLIVGMFALGVGGCAVAPRDAETVANSVHATNDPYAKVKTVSTGNCIAYSTTGSVGVGRLNKNGVWLDYVEVTHEYWDNWKLLDTGYDTAGRPLVVMPTERKVISCGNSCRYSETVVVYTAVDALSSAKDAGMRFKLYGKGGNVEVDVPASCIQGFLSKFDSLKDQS